MTIKVTCYEPDKEVSVAGRDRVKQEYLDVKVMGNLLASGLYLLSNNVSL